MSVKFATHEEASELIVTCGLCHKPRMFSVTEHPDGHFEMTRCSDPKACSKHCQCAIPTLTHIFEQRELLASISYPNR